MKKRLLMLILGGLAAFALIVLGYVSVSQSIKRKNIGSYVDCIKLYPQQTLIYPPRCETPDGRIFIDPAATNPATPPSTIGMANPASVYCVEQGGKLEIISEEPPEAPGGGGGQVGMCTLPGGQVCEEWAFYRGECRD